MDRTALVARWLELTKVVLPAQASAERWPIRLDHCFMRVFLDHATQGPWHETIPRPALRNMPTADLATAVALAEQVLADPALLPGLNAQSLDWRGKRSAARAGRL